MKEVVVIIPVSIPNSWLREKEAGRGSLPLMHPSSEGLPLLIVVIRNVGFNFLMDTSVRYNLIDPYLMEWILPDPTPIGWMDKYAPTNVIHEHLPKQTMICKDGVKRNCEVIQLEFAITEIDGSTQEHSAPFALDPSMSRFFLLPEPDGIVQRHKTIAGVLGMDFLTEHEFCLNFSRPEE